MLSWTLIGRLPRLAQASSSRDFALLAKFNCPSRAASNKTPSYTQNGNNIGPQRRLCTLCSLILQISARHLPDTESQLRNILFTSSVGTHAKSCSHNLNVYNHHYHQTLHHYRQILCTIRQYKIAAINFQPHTNSRTFLPRQRTPRAHKP